MLADVPVEANAERAASLAEATTLAQEALARLAAGQAEEARAPAERARSFAETTLGPEHPDLAAALSVIALIDERTHRLAEAEAGYVRALSIWERAGGPEHPDAVVALNGLTQIYYARGRYGEAVALCERALALRTRTLGAAHPEVAASLTDIGRLAQAMGDYASAATRYKQALAILADAHGSNHPDVATVMIHLGTVRHTQGAYTDAEALLENAYRIRMATLGPDHIDTAASVECLAALRMAQGRYGEAMDGFGEAMRVYESCLGPDHTSVANVLNGLAGAYHAQALDAVAEPLYQRALTIRERVLGPDHPAAAVTLNDLAVLSLDQGAFAAADARSTRSVQILVAALGPLHLHVAAALQNLGNLRAVLGAHSAAEELYGRALAIRERALGPDHPEVADLLVHLAGVHEARGAYDAAAPLYERARAIHECALGPAHPTVAAARNNIAGLHLLRGDYAQANAELDGLDQILERAHGADHPYLVTLYQNRAAACWGVGDRVGACAWLAAGHEASERLLAGVLPTLSEVRQRQLLRRENLRGEVSIAFHVHHAPADRDALALAFTATLRRKGRVLDELARAHRATYDEATGRHADATDGLATAAGQGRAVERPCRRAPAAPPTIDAVQRVLPRGAALVEFARYKRIDLTATGPQWAEARYVAYVLREDGPPRWVALGDAHEIEAAVAATLAGLAHPGPDDPTALRALHALVFAPVAALLDGVDHVLLAPDAALHMVPFAALLDAHGEPLLEHTRITYLTSGRDLVRGALGAARARPLVIAASNFGDRGRALPGAVAEAEAIRAQFPEVELHVDTAAARDKLLAARGPRFVHVATHGFARTTGPVAAAAGARGEIRDVTAPPPALGERAEIEDALDDAGLRFADDDDAILTARQLTSLDLHGTQLVVLSACDTGGGDLGHSEGVYGLRRALAIAGAQTQVVSLWKVDDDATCALMGRYYDGLRRGEGRAESLRQAQVALRHGGRYAHPCYWAAFVMIGDPGPLGP
jgi:CHAT domain-containing protein/tetratricopeptide (TPR) repeat protein